jgi:tetratricopeptide (TPR) repeat protein
MEEVLMEGDKLTVGGTRARRVAGLIGLLVLSGCVSRTADEYGQLAWLHLQEGRYDDAASDARRAIREDPRYAKGYLLLCSALESGPTPDADSAMTACRQALDLAPDTLVAHQGIAWGFEHKKDWRSAIQEYRLEISSQEKGTADGKVNMNRIAYLHFKIGSALVELGDVAGAITESVEEARANDDPRAPHRADANHMQRSLKNRGLLTTAIANDQDLVRSKPANAEAYRQLGLAFEADEQFELAANAYAQACKLGPAESKSCADARWLSEKLHSSGKQ